MGGKAKQPQKLLLRLRDAGRRGGAAGYFFYPVQKSNRFAGLQGALLLPTWPSLILISVAQTSARVEGSLHTAPSFFCACVETSTSLCLLLPELSSDWFSFRRLLYQFDMAAVAFVK